MKSIFFTGLLVLGSFAQAHIEEGDWQGVTSDGKPCVMTAGQAYFENNLPHPLNERIPIMSGGATIVVHHPSAIASATGKVTFNHDLFQGLLATPTGARAIEIEMVHTANFEGPRSFTLMEDNWKTSRQVSQKCSNLQHTAARPGFRRF